MTITHLSDVIRMGLLYRYGGMWIDATYYVANPIPDEFFMRKFFTLRMEKPKWRADVSRGRWACNLLVMKPENILASFVLEAFYEYWRSQNRLLDYYLFDYIIATTYNNLPEVRAMIDECEFTNPQVFELKNLLGEKYNSEVFKELTLNTNFFKLTYRVAPDKENVVGEKTFYGVMVKEDRLKDKQNFLK